MTPPTVLFDARSDPPGPLPWRTFTDRVMGGRSDASAATETVDGEPALVLRGTVRLDNGGGFAQMAAELTPAAAGAAAAAAGLRLRLWAATGTDVGVHLRSADLSAPWQAWRAGVAGTGAWQEALLPWAEFRPYRTDRALRPAALQRVGLVALGRPGPFAFALGRLELAG